MAEIWRRLSNPNSSNETAKRFQERCKRQGVPIEALNRVDYVGASRVIGQGNAFMRKQSVDAIAPVVGSLPEEGRNNWLNDKIAAEAGQAAINRYNPPQKQQTATEQNERAVNQVTGMKVGVPPVVDSSQNPVVFAQTFLKAGVDALTSLQQGGNPLEVLAFLTLCGPAIAAHLERMMNDITRKKVYSVLEKQWEMLAMQTDKLRALTMKIQEQAKAQQQAQAQAMTDEQLKAAKTQSDIALKTVKTQAQLQQSQEKHQLKMAQGVQDLKLKDAMTASQIHLDNKMTEHELRKPEPAAKE
jgi:hypothetical protein